MSYSKSLAALTAAAIMAGSGAASAAVLGPTSGNECGAGGFSDCSLTINGTASPAVIKFGSNFDVSDISTFYPSVSGEEFSFFNIIEDEGEVDGAAFTYTLGEDDPDLSGYAVFAAGSYLLYDSEELTFEDGVYIGSFTTFGLGNNENNPAPGLSHITFFGGERPGDGGELPDGGGGDPTLAPIPLPAGGLLLMTGLAGLAVSRRRH